MQNQDTPKISFNFVNTSYKTFQFIDNFCDLLSLILKENYPNFNIHSISSLNTDYHYVVGLLINNKYYYIDIYGIWEENNIINFWNNMLSDKNLTIKNNKPDLSCSEIDSEIVSLAKEFSQLILKKLYKIENVLSN